MPEDIKEIAGEKEETSVAYKRDAAPTEFVDGFSWYTVIGAFFVGFIMMPASIYMGLLAGGGIGAAAQWVTIILFMEIVRRSFGVMKKQEIFILYYIAGGLVGGGPFGGFIWSQYLLQTPAAAGFGIVKTLQAEGVKWIAPMPGSEALIKRTFFHRDWLQPIALMLSCAILGKLNWFGLGYFVFRMTSDVERLPFPMAPVAAGGATALADASMGRRETWRWNVFSIGSVIGMAFGSLYIFVPTFTGAVWGRALQILPIPFVDLTTNSEGILPGSVIGLSTDLGAVLAGFVVPFPIVVGTFIASLVSQIILNPIFYRLGLFPDWRHGMGSIQTSMATSINFWMSIGIGVAITVAILGIYTCISTMGKSKGAKLGRLAPVPGRGDIPVWAAIVLFITSTVGFIYICHRLIPPFPVWLLIFYGFVWTPLDSYISGRMSGLVAGDVAFPYLKEATFILSGYKGVAIWWAPIPLHDYGGMGQMFRQVELTGTKFTSVIKAELLMFPIVIVSSFIYWSFLWKLGPIPSSIYPYVAKFWPLNATMQCLWVTATSEGTNWLLKAIKLKFIIMGAASAGALYGLTSLLSLPILFYYGLLGGIGGWPHGSIPMFFGAMLGKYYFAKQYGAERWRAFAPVLLAGFYCGMGLTGMAGIAVSFIAKSVYQMPF